MGFFVEEEYLYPLDEEVATLLDAPDDGFLSPADEYVVVLLLLLDFFFFVPPLDPPAEPKSASRFADAFCL